MVTKEQIRELPRKYAIGKRPLSRVLGWGELTYTRLLDGSVPTPQHAKELQKALDDPLAYIMLLERAHSKGLVADSSYERSRKAAEKRLGESVDVRSPMKLHAVAEYLCVLSKGDITPNALQLLVYYAQGFSLAKLKKPLFNESPRALPDGPAYDLLADWFTYDRIQDVAASGKDAVVGLSDAERELVEDAFVRYGVYSAGKLAEMARSESPWKKTRKRMASSADGDDLIEVKRMAKFFSKAAKR